MNKQKEKCDVYYEIYCSACRLSQISPLLLSLSLLILGSKKLYKSSSSSSQSGSQLTDNMQ